MFCIDNVVRDYFAYRNNLKSYRLYKEELYSFYVLHNSEIEEYIVDYYEVIKDKMKVRALLSNHPNLKTYLSLDIVRKHFEEEYKKYVVSAELTKLGMCAICIYNDILVIYDIENNINYSYEISNKRIINYIEKGLQKLHKFVSEINIEEISLLKVLYEEFKNNNLEDKSMCKRMSNELLKARMFDSYYIESTENKNLPKSIDEELQKLAQLYKNENITKEEYYIRYYFYIILSEQNVEKLYLNADDEHKEYIIKAYLELSKTGNNSIHIRTASELINKEVLKKIRKKDTNK